MDIRNRRQLKGEARRSLAMASYNPRYLVLIHTGATILLSLLVMALDFVLENQIGNTGGLGGMGLRSVLSTIQTVLQIVEFVVLPFWEFGYVFTVLRLARVQEAQPDTLLTGFRHIGPVLRYTLLQTLLYCAIAIPVFYLAVSIFMFTPWAAPLYEAMLPLMNETSLTTQELLLNEAATAAIMDAYVPIFAIFGVLYLLICAPLYYGLRMGSFCLMDAPEKGALAAMRESRRMMKGRRIQLLRLDLSFWWYYLLYALLTVVCYGDLLLPLIGVELPWSSTVSFFVFYILSLVFQLVLYILTRNQVEVTYALAYDALRQTPRETPQPNPGNQPWNY